MSYITIRDLSIGADFGAQMMALAGLYSVAVKTGHTPVIINEKQNEGYKIRITRDIFPNFYNVYSNIDYVKHKWEWRDFKSELIDKEIYNNLNQNINYNFDVGFNNYHYWKDLDKEVRQLFEFHPEIVKLSQLFIDGIKKWSNCKEIVGVHFRRGDYLKLSSLNLSMNYYYDALKNFDPNKYCLLIFSNTNSDIEWLRTNFKPEGYDIWETDHNYPARLDMCVMSLCDHMIIANSSYSWWGAYLNKKQNKQIFCPYNFLNLPSLNYINGNYYPQEWKPIHMI